MTTHSTIPATENESWGFWGTMEEHASAAWPLAITAIANATNQPLATVKTFLDSRHGRHFADYVYNALFEGQTLPMAIDAATQHWMGWRISYQTSKKYGIPQELPYLTGFVMHCEIAAEAAA